MKGLTDDVIREIEESAKTGLMPDEHEEYEKRVRQLKAERITDEGLGELTAILIQLGVNSIVDVVRADEATQALIYKVRCSMVENILLIG